MGRTKLYCDHPCCEIRDNPVHFHTVEPHECRHCRIVRLRDEAVSAGADENIIGELCDELPALVRTVLTKITPQIAGLPTGAELDDLVCATALAVYLASRRDPKLRGLLPHERRLALSSRVGKALSHHRPARVSQVP